MFDRVRRAVLATRRGLLLGSLCFSRLLTVRVARAVLSKLSLDVDPEPSGPRQLLADVSVISQSDAGTGIQRVVRELLRELIANPPPGYEVRPVYATRWHRYQYAEHYRSALQGKDTGAGPTGPVHVQAGDVFLGMDLAAGTLPRYHVQLGRWKASGVRFFFLVYDLLPVLHPEWFTPQLVKAYRDWIRTVAIFADGVVCISRSVSDQLKQWLADMYGNRVSLSISVMWFYLSGDISSGIPSRQPTKLDHLLARVSKRPAILMVGTIEPRKGYAQALSAFEVLWREKREVNLAIVGGAGWKVDALVHRLRNHPEVGNRLHWFEQASDEMLNVLYGAVDGLLLASEGEGFGLPIVEAARYGKPILARDVPVFREIAGNHIRYFDGGTPAELATELSVWLDSIKDGSVIKSEGIKRLSWEESARQLLNCLVVDS